MGDSRITVVSPDRQHLGDIERALQKRNSATRVVAIEGTLQRLGIMTTQLAADILIVDCSDEDVAAIAPLEQLGLLYPKLTFIVLCRQQSPEFLIQAMRLGVREVLQSPVNAVALEAAIDRINSKASGSASKSGKILAFTSCKGGSGATFLATNLAYTLAVEGQQRVALFDFNLQFGDALLFLTDQKAATTLSDVVQDIHRLDAAFLATSMASVAPNLSILAAPDDPARAMEVKPEHIDALLKLARAQYDYIIVDVGRILDAPTIRALDHADTIYAVLQTTLPFVRGAKHMLDVFRTLDYSDRKVELVVNRYEKDSDLGLKDLHKALGAPVRRAIPNHYTVAAASVNQGIALNKLTRVSPLSRALTEWGEQLHHKLPEAGSSSWINRMLKRA